MEKLGGISVFVEVVEAGGFSAAASGLNLTRSAVGKTIARLEAAFREIHTARTGLAASEWQ